MIKKYTIKEQKPKNEKRDYRSAEDTEYYKVADNKVTIFKRDRSKYYQYRFWIATDKRYMKRSSGKTNLEDAKDEALKHYYGVKSDISRGKKIFGLTMIECADMYLQERLLDVPKNITHERYLTVKTQINRHIIPYINQKYDKDFRAMNLEKNDFWDYARYREVRTTGKVNKVTIKNEQTTINHFIMFLYAKDYCKVSKMLFPKILIRQTDIGRRDTFDFPDEYNLFLVKQREWVKQSKDDYTEYYNSQVRDLNLFLANSGLRIKEALNLKWSNVHIYSKLDSKRREIHLIRVTVPKEIAKNRKERTFRCAGGNYLMRLIKNSNFTEKDNYIFAQHNKDTPTNRYTLYRKLKELIMFTGLGKTGKNFTFYSFRHLYITLRLQMKVPIYEVAVNAGTDVRFIETHYSHFDEKASEQFAMKIFLEKDRESLIVSPESYEQSYELEDMKPILKKNAKKRLDYRIKYPSK